MNDNDKCESLDERDYPVLARLGYAIGRAQLFELALLKLLEVQRHDPETPFEERWPEIHNWLRHYTAGKAAKKLHLPEEIASDLANVVQRRDLVAHHAWRFYIHRKERHGTEEAAEVYGEWLDEQAHYIGLAYNGLMALTDLGREKLPSALGGAEAIAAWRSRVNEPVDPTDAPTP